MVENLEKTVLPSPPSKLAMPSCSLSHVWKASVPKPLNWVLSSIADSKRKPTARTRQLPFHGSLKIQSYVVWHHFSLWITLYPMTHSLTTFQPELSGCWNQTTMIPEVHKPAQGLWLFGRRNVERWKQQGKAGILQTSGESWIQDCRSLWLLQRTTQDYFNNSIKK